MTPNGDRSTHLVLRYQIFNWVRRWRRRAILEHTWAAVGNSRSLDGEVNDRVEAFAERLKFSFPGRSDRIQFIWSYPVVLRVWPWACCRNRAASPRNRQEVKRTSTHTHTQTHRGLRLSAQKCTVNWHLAERDCARRTTSRRRRRKGRKVGARDTHRRADCAVRSGLCDMRPWKRNENDVPGGPTVLLSIS